jgi:hypothetical protein
MDEKNSGEKESSGSCFKIVLRTLIIQKKKSKKNCKKYCNFNPEDENFQDNG